MRRLALYLGVTVIAFLTGFFCAKTGNSLAQAALLRDAPEEAPAAEIVTQEPSTPAAPVQEVKLDESSSPYADAGIVVWDVREKGIRLEARVTSLKQDLPPEVFRDSPYWSRLTIKNLQSNKVLYDEKFSGLFVSMYTRDLNNDSHVELIVTMTPGAVCEQLSIFEVTPERARLILYKPHRLLGDAEFVNVEGNLTDVIITDAELGTGPYYTTRYVWQGKKYRPVATVAAEEYFKNRQSLFKKWRRSSKSWVDALVRRFRDV
ncbi:MAG TPA: hypothetical protein VJT74_14035 [Pyrinomonadaceae bacterium]|nr:hypothetical protein [Pyrinomonadaceae bacterium]